MPATDAHRPVDPATDPSRCWPSPLDRDNRANSARSLRTEGAKDDSRRHTDPGPESVVPVSDAGFVHLRVHSDYTILEGAVRIGDLVSLCKQFRMPAVAMIDSGNLFGAMEFASSASNAGIQPIVGTLLAVGDIRHHHGPHEGEPASIVLLTQNETGYRNLLELVSASVLETSGTEIPHLEWNRLEGHTDGLIVLSGGPQGPVGRALAGGRTDVAKQLLERFQELFPDRLYVELMRHGEDSCSEKEEALVELARTLDLPLVATNDVHFCAEEDYEAHDALLCMASSRQVKEEDRPRLTPDHRFKTGEEMRALFADLPEAADNTLAIAQRCTFVPCGRKPILPSYPSGRSVSEEEELRLQATEGLETRLERHVFTPEMDADERKHVGSAYRERLEIELDIIARTQFPGYFLIVADYVQWAKRQGIPVGPGRGSGASSVVAWALTITDLDPMRFGLLFERFLNPERLSMPDFDVELCQDRRDEVIDYVRQRHGFDRVARIITFGMFEPRAVVRDVGRVLGMSDDQLDRLAKMVPDDPAVPLGLQHAIDDEKELQQARRGTEVAHLLDIALKLEGLHRHASIDAAAVVIADRPLQQLVPLCRDSHSPGLPVTQFARKSAERAGLVAFDILGLKTPTVLEDTRKALQERGIEIDLLNLPPDDERTFQMLSRGDSVGVFKMEGAGMQDALRQLRPNSIEDIIAIYSLYRPGPMDRIPLLCNRKHGREPISYLHPKLEPVLKETYGIIIYHEQVMQIARILAGYSLGEADLLRRAMGKKLKVEMVAQRKRFISGAVERGIDEQQAISIFERVDKFAGYGFLKSHAAAYALIAYQTAWLKANHPVEFMEASAKHEPRHAEQRTHGT